MVATLEDPELEARLASEGYVVLDLLTGSDAGSNLLALCQRLYPTPKSGSEYGYFSPNHLRRAAHEGITSAFTAAVQRMFVDHRVVLGSFIVKWPGPDGVLPLHQHATLVDNQRYRSAVIWCALTPATEESGTLHVVPKSHAIQVGPHAENAESWHQPHATALLRNHLVSLDVNPGQAVVFDNQLVHCSFSNTSRAPRMTAVALVAPRRAELFRFIMTSESTVSTHPFPSNVHLDGSELDALPSAPAMAVVDWSPTVVNAADLRRLIPKGTCHHEGP